ncbi:MAG: hypothetical protein QM758_19055 [Armatimonas sp.]
MHARIKPLLGIALGVFLSVGIAQAEPPAPPAVPKRVPAIDLSQRTVKELAAKLTKESGFLVVADSTVANNRVSLNTVGGPLETVLQQLLAAMPKGSLIKKAHMPSAAATSPDPNPEVVSILIQVNDALAAPMNPGTKPDPDAVIVQGRIIPKDKAADVLAALDMKPVYLLTNPQGRSATQSFANMQADIMRLWQNMTPEQRKASVERQWDDFMNMDPNARKAYMQQMMEQAVGISQKLQQLPPAQLKELFGGILPPGAFGGGKN